MNKIVPKPSQWLYASCSAENYGQILWVGKDENGADVMDIRVCSPSDLIDCQDDDRKPEGERSWRTNPLTMAEVDPSWGSVILRSVQWIAGDDWVELNTPGNGCFRCTKLFCLRDDPQADNGAEWLKAIERRRVAAAAPALLRALVKLEWSGSANYGTNDCCPECRQDEAWRLDEGRTAHSARCPLDAAMTAAGLPDQASRDAARKRIAGGETCAD